MRLAIYHISDFGCGGIGNGHIDFKAQYEVLMVGGSLGEIAIEPVLPLLNPSTAPKTDTDKHVRVAKWNGYGWDLLECKKVSAVPSYRLGEMPSALCQRASTRRLGYDARRVAETLAQLNGYSKLGKTGSVDYIVECEHITCGLQFWGDTHMKPQDI